MKYSVLVLLLCCCLNGYCQADKTAGWKLPQQGVLKFSISKNSPRHGQYYYEGAAIKAAAAGNLHIEIATDPSLDSTFKKEKYLLSIRSGDKELVNKLVDYEDFLTERYALNLTLTKTDTDIFVECARPAGVKDTIPFRVSYIFADTMALDYSNKNARDVFYRMLELAPAGYTNLAGLEPDDIFAAVKTLKYPGGLFAAAPADKTTFGSAITQYTVYRATAKTAADRSYSEWVKKIADWLKDYNVTDVTDNSAEPMKTNMYNEYTTYVKKNAAGDVLFRVSVFKESDKTISKATGKTLEELYSAGVRITAGR